MKKPAHQEKREPAEWQISTEAVTKLSVGELVNIHGQDAEGNHRVISCVVAFNGRRKILTYRDGGQIRHCAIRDYPGKYYTKITG